MNNLLEQFLDQLEVRHTRLFVDKLYNEHPHRNNMYGLKKMLDIFGVRTLGVSVNVKDLSQLNYPCILHTRTDFVVGTAFDGKAVSYIMHGKTLKSSIEEFKKIWTGHALVVEEETEAKEPDFRKHLREDRIEMAKSLSIPSIILLAVIVCIPFNFKTFQIYSFSGIALSMAGVCLCALLLQKQLYGESRLGDRVCSLLRHADCNSLLNGDKSKVFGISWSEVGMGYFIANILLLTLYPVSLCSVATINWFAMCYGVWSVLYQWRVAKNWCALCLTVQVIVWVMGLTAACSVACDFDAKVLILSCLFFALCIMLVHYLITLYVAQKERVQIMQRYRALKVNRNVAKALIEQGDYYETTLDDSTILLGNPNASMRVTILSNPHCNPCATMHTRVAQLLALNADELCVQYIFSSFNKELEDSSRYLIALYDGQNMASTLAAYKRWYEKDKFDYKDVVKRAGESIHSDTVEREMVRHHEWRKRTGLIETPTILVNGHILPKEYELEDLAMIVNCQIAEGKKNILRDINGRSTTPLEAGQLPAVETM